MQMVFIAHFIRPSVLVYLFMTKMVKRYAVNQPNLGTLDQFVDILHYYVRMHYSSIYSKLYITVTVIGPINNNTIFLEETGLVHYTQTTCIDVIVWNEKEGQCNLNNLLGQGHSNDHVYVYSINL